MSGLELLDQLRRDGITTPAMFMTGALDARIRSAVDRVGALLLEKPFRAGELVGCIERALAHERD